jgi:hypothetical protein
MTKQSHSHRKKHDYRLLHMLDKIILVSSGVCILTISISFYTKTHGYATNKNVASDVNFKKYILILHAKPRSSLVFIFNIKVILWQKF